MLANLADLREQIAVLSNDLESIERVMETLGYEGEMPTKASRVPRVVLSTAANFAASYGNP